MSAHWSADLLAGDVAVVTGGGQGIGLAIAQEMAAAGAAVAMFELDAERGKGAAEHVIAVTGNDKVASFALDVRDIDAVGAAVDNACNRFGNVSIVASNAGITRDAYLRRMTFDQFDEVLAVHLRGAFTVLKACLEPMIERGGGAVVNMASSTGPYGNPGQANYGAAKAGIIGLTRSAAVELSRFSIRVNAIAPGAVDTPMMQAIGADKVQGFVDLIPLGRLADAREVAHAAVFLASPLSSYVTGHVLFVDGGFTVAG